MMSHTSSAATATSTMFQMVRPLGKQVVHGYLALYDSRMAPVPDTVWCDIGNDQRLACACNTLKHRQPVAKFPFFIGIYGIGKLRKIHLAYIDDPVYRSITKSI